MDLSDSVIWTLTINLIVKILNASINLHNVETVFNTQLYIKFHHLYWLNQIYDKNLTPVWRNKKVRSSPTFISALLIPLFIFTQLFTHFPSFLFQIKCRTCSVIFSSLVHNSQFLISKPYILHWEKNLFASNNAY